MRLQLNLWLLTATLCVPSCRESDASTPSLFGDELQGTRPGDVTESTPDAPYLAFLTVTRAIVLLDGTPESTERHTAMGFWIAPRVIVTSCRALQRAHTVHVTLTRFVGLVRGLPRYETFDVEVAKPTRVRPDYIDYTDTKSVLCFKDNYAGFAGAGKTDPTRATESDVAVIVLPDDGKQPSLQAREYPHLADGYDQKDSLQIVAAQTELGLDRTPLKRALRSKPFTIAQQTGERLYLRTASGLRLSEADFGAPVLRTPADCTGPNRPTVVGMAGFFLPGTYTPSPLVANTIYRIDDGTADVNGWLRKQVALNSGFATTE